MPIESKGISLPLEQWRTLEEAFDGIDEAIESVDRGEERVSFALGPNRLIVVSSLSGRTVVNLLRRENREPYPLRDLFGKGAVC